MRAVYCLDLNKEYKNSTEAAKDMKVSSSVIMRCCNGKEELTLNAFTASDSVLIPVQCEYYALEGLSQLIHTINLVRDRLNDTLTIDGIVFTMFDSRTNLSEQVVENVVENIDYHVYKSMIPRNIRLAEAPSYGQPICTYDPKSAGAIKYNELAREIIKQNSK